MWLKLVLAVVVLFHGIGHLLFLGPTIGAVDWAGQTGHSWALTGVLGDGPTRTLGALIWVATIVVSWPAWPHSSRRSRGGSAVTGHGVGALDRRHRPDADGIATTNAVMAHADDIVTWCRSSGRGRRHRRSSTRRKRGGPPVRWARGDRSSR